MVMKKCGLIMAFVFLAISASLHSANAQNAATSLPGFDRATMVVMAPNGPVIVDLRISVAKIAYRAWVGKYLASQLDSDRNGRLDAQELALLTDNIRQLGKISDPAEVLRASGETPNNDVSTRDFAAWLHQRLPKAFDLIAQPQTSDDAVRLSSLIDTDQDGTISATELQGAFRTLRFRDLDNDETFSVSELLPYRDPLNQNAAVTPDVVNLPFFHITDSASLKLAAERVLKRYGQQDRVDARVFRQSTDAAADSSPSMPAMTLNDVEALLGEPQFHLTIDVRLSDRANTSDIDVMINPAAAQFCSVSDDTFGQTALKVDGLPIKVVARGGGANNRALTRGFLGQSFVMVDADRNQYLDEAEFAGIVAALQQSGANGDFSVVDRNADKMVTRDELFSFADRDQMASASRIEVTVKQDGKTLFGLLDSNEDRRLSVREVRSGNNTLKQYDLNGDGVFAETELGTEYVLTFGLGQPALRRSMGSSQMMNSMTMRNGDAILPGLTGLVGPEWFRRMDRNQDGDVSRREFPGSSAHFQQVDTDGDQLISAAEAEAISATASRSDSR